MIVSPGRPVSARYMDPLSVVWLATARRLGLTVRRNPSVYAATNGAGLLELGPGETLDPDDCDAQMIFHELCHWITNGEDSVGVPDWGCALEGEEIWREQATLRVQRALAEPHGLERLLAPTTDHRVYYDRLAGGGPVQGYEDEARAMALAQQALARADGPPWGLALREALEATARIQAAISPFLGSYASDRADDALPSLWASPAGRGGAS